MPFTRQTVLRVLSAPNLHFTAIKMMHDLPKPRRPRAARTAIKTDRARRSIGKGPAPAAPALAPNAACSAAHVAYDALPGLVYELRRDANGAYHVDYVSGACRDMLGVEPQSLVGDFGHFLQHFAASSHADMQRTLHASAMTMTPWIWEARLSARPALNLWLYSSAQPQPCADGTLTWTGLCTDISARKHAESSLERALADVSEMAVRERLRAEALVQIRHSADDVHGWLPADQVKILHAEKSASLTRLSLGLAHEINNPLSGVMYLFDALQRGQPEAAQRDEYVALINAGLLRIQNTVCGLLDYAQPREPRKIDVRPADICAAALNRIEAAALAKHIRVTTQLAVDAHWVEADPALLTQALVNVLLNAVHAAPVRSEVMLACTADAAGFAIIVRDRGVGIPTEYAHRVCDPFFTTKLQGEGTGLGLATASRMLEAHGGKLLVENDAGGGARVTLWLPAKDDSGQKRSASPQAI